MHPPVLAMALETDYLTAQRLSLQYMIQPWDPPVPLMALKFIVKWSIDDSHGSQFKDNINCNKYIISNETQL